MHFVSIVGGQQSKNMDIAITALKQRAAFMHGEIVHIERSYFSAGSDIRQEDNNAMANSGIVLD